MPLVSCICLTTWPRRQAYLPDALRSYRQQTYPDRELVVVNDGDPLVSHATDVTVVNLPPVGRRWTIGEKRNVGVRAARGTYLATWDDDDISLPDRLSKEMDAMLRGRADYVVADKMLIADSDMNLQGDCDRGKVRPVQPSALVRKSAIVAVGGYPIANYLEDLQVLKRIQFLLRGHIVTVQGSDWYVMRRHDQNITLTAGEKNAAYLACALRSPDVVRQQRLVDAVRNGPGEKDVTP